jgi:16S rRNA (guanine1207-N2)-methyltransferase
LVVTQYFDASPAASHRPASVMLALPDVSLRLATDSGVFAGSGVDPGTKYLLLDGPRPDAAGTAPLLDLGCGYGPIALTLARRAPKAAVFAVDVNERARRLCAANAAANGLTNVTVCAPDEVPASLQFGGIWSNPPIRVGKTALHELLLRWLTRLAPEAHAYLVVQRHLGSDSLGTWLTTQGCVVQRLGSRRSYRILDVCREPGA